MTITEDVVNDLLPLYFDGEASPDSRSVVETWFASHPAFAQAARRGSGAFDALATMSPPPLDQAGAREALRRVHRIILWREVSLGLAMSLSVCPILVVACALLFPAQTSPVLQDKLPLCVGLFVLVAAPAWVSYLIARRKPEANLLRSRARVVSD